MAQFNELLQLRELRILKTKCRIWRLPKTILSSTHLPLRIIEHEYDNLSSLNEDENDFALHSANKFAQHQSDFTPDKSPFEPTNCNFSFSFLFFLFMPVYEFSILFYRRLNSALELRIREERCGSSSHFYVISSAFEISEDPLRYSLSPV